MALSNWDTIAFNNDGESCNGIFKNSKGSVLEIYKNWIYISNEKMWVKDGPYRKPVIAQIIDGNIQIAGFDITAIRGSQSGIFVFASAFKNVAKDEFKNFYFGGIGCSGYRDTVEETLSSLGRSPDISDKWVSGSGFDGELDTRFILNLETGERIVYWDCNKQGPYDYDKDWIGVLPKTIEEYLSWLETTKEDLGKDFEEWIEKIKKNPSKLRFNQGDAFFSDKLKIPLPATRAGESEGPILHDIIK